MAIKVNQALQQLIANNSSQLPVADKMLQQQNITNFQNLFEHQGTKQNVPTQQKTSSLRNQALGAGISIGTDILTNKLSDNIFGDSELGRGLGTLFSSGISSSGNTIANNLIKGEALSQGLSKNAGTSLAGTIAGLAGQGIGAGINALGGDSVLSRGLGAGIATGIGTVGGQILGNLVSTGKALGNLAKGSNLIGTSSGKLFSLKSGLGQINPIGLGGQVLGAALGAMTGPSKEYGGKYGNITQIADTAYDVIGAGVNFIPGVGQGISGIMALNKGLSNIFGSTDGMTKTDAILGSAFMPAPVKWLNMWGSTKTGTFDNQSWQNTSKAENFMGNAFGNLNDRFNRAREEAGKTYGTFSYSAKKEAQDNIDFANQAWKKILNMADQNEWQNIRSQAMSSINNQRYAQMIQGGFNPIYRGKQGMKIFNNATNHNIGMRLLSGAALIDNKQMILCSAVD